MLHIKKSPFLLKNIVAGIATECFMKGYDVSQNTVELVVRNNLYNPDIKISYNMENRKKELEDLSNACVSMLCSNDEMQRKLLALQACYLSECGGEEHIIKQYESLMYFYLEPLVKLIASMKPESREEMDRLQNLIVKYTILSTGVGHPNDTKTFQDTEAALKSVLSFQDLQRFCLDSAEIRKELLSQIAHIVTGVRLFNKSRGKSDENIEDFPTLLSDCLEATSCIFLLHIEHCRQRMRTLHKLMDGCIVFLPTPGVPNIQLQRPKHLSDEEYKYAFYMLLIQQQVISYLRSMYFDIRTLVNNFENWLTDYTKILIDIQSIVNNKIAVPTRIIYPMFVSLSLAYTKFYNGIVILSTYERTLYQLTQFFKFEDIPKKLEEMLKEDNADGMEWDAFNFQESLNLKEVEMDNFMNSIAKNEYREEIETADPERFTPGKINPERVPCEVIFPDAKDINDCDIMFGGFDPVCVVEGEGLVLEAEPNIGLLKYKGLYFGFTTPLSAYIFATDPKRYFGKVLDFVRLNPAYIEILRIRNYLDYFIGYGRLCTEGDKTVTKCDEEVQTVTHLYEYIHDKCYEHSKWQITKAACKLADLTRRRTVSCQTKSYFREDCQNQTYKKREAGVEAMRDVWTNTAAPSVFRYGLRGQWRDDIQADVSLTLPIREPHVSLMKSKAEGKKEQEVQTSDMEYFDKCSTFKIKPHQPMYYAW